MRPDIAFIGANGIEPHFGISTPGMNEAIVKTAICKSARRVVLLCDSAKFGQESWSASLDLRILTPSLPIASPKVPSVRQLRPQTLRL